MHSIYVATPAVLAFGLLGLGILHSTDGGQAKEVLLETASFAADLAGWERVGRAEFDADPAAQYQGRVSARIRVPEGSPLAYQQLRRDFRDDIRAGDEFAASVWVRAEGVDQDPGAYMALEFVAADGSRAGIAHSRSSKENGMHGWEKLEASGAAPVGTACVRLSLILHAHGAAWFVGPSLTRTARLTPWPDLGDRVRHIDIDPSSVVQPRFAGVGFHAFHHIFVASDEELDEVVYKRWREMNPSFVRMNDNYDYDKPMMERIASHMARMKETGTEIYLTTWNPPDVETPEELQKWAQRVADNLEFYTRTRGITNLRTYCMTNELSLGGWGRLVNNLSRFRQYHRALHEELQRRRIAVGLLATDASPVEYWHTIQWAADNMDEITAIYGGHHYFNNHPPDDERFYPWWLQKLQDVVAVARRRGKDFILGEFGARQDGRTIDGVRQDRCVFFETPQEPLVTIQLAEAVIAAVNAGVYGMGYWTFMDLPDDFAPGYVNKWGTFRCSGEDRSTRAIYYGYALLTRYLRGPAAAVRVTSDDPRLRAAAVQHHRGKTWSIAVVNRNKNPVPVQLRLHGAADARFRKYVYDPANVHHHPFGDLPGPVGVVAMKKGALADTVLPGSLTVYTTAYDDIPPSAVRHVRVEREGGDNRIAWDPLGTQDLCYYRVYRLEGARKQQIRSTVGTSVLDRGAPLHARYAVAAVDRSGNEGPLSK